jgi:hypothetical protein
MAIEKKEVLYAKELSDVMDLLVGLVDDIKQKKSISEIGAENLPLLMAAVDGLGALDDEFLGDRKVALETIGSKLGDLVDVFLPK